MMHSRTPRSLCAIALVALVLVNATPALSCGPFFPQAVFTYKFHPDFPLENFVRGQLGVLQPGYARSYLFVAYRYLSGNVLIPAEQKAVVGLWNQRLGIGDSGQFDASVKEWLTARSAVLKLGSPSRIEVHRFGSDYAWFFNCLEDAFRVATRTLRERSATFGPTSADLKEWLSGQDQVFTNCPGGGSIPGPVSTSTTPLLQADRAYQIAAAHFYAGNFDVSENLFRKIAADATNPWQLTAAYLVLRTLIRKSSGDDADAPRRIAQLKQAEQEIHKVMADQRYSSVHASSAKLLGYVQYRLYPRQRQAALAKVLVKNDRADSLQQDLSDYTWLLDHPQPRVGLDDLSDWIFTFQDNDGFALRHALDKWRETKAQHWLVASITKLEGGEKELPEVLNAAAAVPVADVGFATVIYHHIRLLTELGQKTEARKLLDQFLARAQPQLPRSALNLFLQKRMALAESLDAFIKFAPRRPAAITTSDDPEQVNREKSPFEGKDYFDNDAAGMLSRALPTDVLKNAVRSSSLPQHLRRDLTLATWTRAVLLDDDKTASELRPDLDRIAPELRADLVGYANEQTGTGRRFATIYLMLRNPGIRPYISAGIGRLTQISRIDDYQDNWWCNLNAIMAKEIPLDTPSLYYEMSTGNKPKAVVKNVPRVSFLNEKQRDAAQRELANLASVSAAPNYFGKQVLAWAKQNPNDPRVPEALHLTVKASRFACGDDATGNYSKAAFELLHKRYPQNQWTKKTPYWYQ
jgi:hypothetical protein